MLQNEFSLRQFRLTNGAFSYIVLRVMRLTYYPRLIQFSNCAELSRLRGDEAQSTNSHATVKNKITASEQFLIPPKKQKGHKVLQ